jgi:hypothetical protein
MRTMLRLSLVLVLALISAGTFEPRFTEHGRGLRDRSRAPA